MRERKLENAWEGSLLVLLMIVIYIRYGASPLFLLEHDAATMSLIYQFYHVNIFHLLANCLSAFVILSSPHPYKHKNILLSYIISCLVYPLAGRPILGMSNFIYAYIGLCTPAFDNPWWKNPKVIGFWIGTLLLLIPTSISGITHIASVVTGILIALVRRVADKYDRQ